MPTTLKATFYPWITQNVMLDDIKKNIEVLLEKLQQELKNSDVVIKLLPAMEVPQQMKSIVNGESQIAFMNPLGFIFSNQLNSRVNACSIVERKIDGEWGIRYYSQLYTHRKTAIREDLFSKTPTEIKEKLKGRSIGFGSPFSTSNFIVPAYELQKKGIKVLTNFSRLEFLGGHELVAQAVYNGKVDIGAGHDGAIIDLSNQYGFGDAKEVLIPLFRSHVPSDPIALNIEDPEKFKMIQTAFEKASMTPEGEQAIAKFWGGARHLKPVDTEPYKFLLDATSALNISREDIFGM